MTELFKSQLYLNDDSEVQPPRCHFDRREKSYQSYIPFVAWNVEYTDDFDEWWDTLTEIQLLPRLKRGKTASGVSFGVLM